MTDSHREISEVIAREEGRLRNFIRRWVVDESDVEDVLQDVFYEFVAAQQLVEPLRQAGAWMFRVARNRMTDLFRRRRVEAARRHVFDEDLDDEAHALETWLPSPEAGPDALYARQVLIQALDLALEELPPEQRSVFLAHEVEGRSFKDLAAESGIPLNTLLSRKHYAVRHLRKRLKAIYEEFVHV